MTIPHFASASASQFAPESASQFVFDCKRPYVIAEIGLHHYGETQRAKKLIDAAARGKANAIKLQMFTPHDLYTVQEIQKGMINDYSLPKEAYYELAQYAKERHLDLACTVFNIEDAAFIDAFVPFYKVASCDLDHVLLLEHLAEKGKPVLVSTAGASPKEIERACEILLAGDVPQIVLMHCVMLYPTPMAAAKMKRIQQLRNDFGGEKISIGYSDHTCATHQMSIMFLAYCLGAHVLEKHFTDEKDTPGLDHAHAMDSQDLLVLQRRLQECNCISLEAKNKIASKMELELEQLVPKDRSCLAKYRSTRKGNFTNVSPLHCHPALLFGWGSH